MVCFIYATTITCLKIVISMAFFFYYLVLNNVDFKSMIILCVPLFFWVPNQAISFYHFSVIKLNVESLQTVKLTNMELDVQKTVDIV